MITWLVFCPPLCNLFCFAHYPPVSLSSLLLIQYPRLVSASGPLDFLFILPGMPFSHLKHGSLNHFIQALHINLFKNSLPCH